MGEVQVLEPSAYQQLIASAVGAATEALFAGGEVHSYTFSKSGGDFKPTPNVAIRLDPGAFERSATLTYTPQPVLEAGDLQHVNHFYELRALDALTGEPIQLAARQSYQIALTYSQRAVPRGLDESTLALYAWRNRQWIREATSQVDPETNMVMATPNHFSRWAILAEPKAAQEVYLPLISR